MNISSLKEHLSNINQLNFNLPDGTQVPSHFHITEIGLQTKHSVDCGRIKHINKKAILQIWVAQDTDHRLKPLALLGIINDAGSILGGDDLEVEIEFQKETIGKYDLGFANKNFELIPQYTDCLARETCGVDTILATVNSSECCTPGKGCC
ncbi:MAG: DUF6428 family protein [Cytophagales bacterium]